MDILFAPVYLILAHTFLGTGVVLVAGYFLVRYLSAHPGPLQDVTSRYGFLILIAGCLTKVFIGHGFAVRLVHVLGKDAQGIVTDSYETATVYNNQNVYGYHVLLALADGRTVQESFRTDSFNVYPPHNSTTYPTVGVHFDAKYLPHFPSAFIILASGNDGFAQDLRCDQLRKTLHAAELKFQFAPTNAAFHQEAIQSLQTYIDASCEMTPEGRDDDRQELKELRRNNGTGFNSESRH